jgi:hypothetical protein
MELVRRKMSFLCRSLLLLGVLLVSAPGMALAVVAVTADKGSYLVRDTMTVTVAGLTPTQLSNSRVGIWRPTDVATYGAIRSSWVSSLSV